MRKGHERRGAIEGSGAELTGKRPKEPRANYPILF